MEKFSKYQQNVIKNYYKNRDDIALQRAQELVTELYLAEGKKRDKVWDTLAQNLEKLGMTADRIAHLRKQNKPELVVEFIQSKF